MSKYLSPSTVVHAPFCAAPVVTVRFRGPQKLARCRDCKAEAVLDGQARRAELDNPLPMLNRPPATGPLPNPGAATAHRLGVPYYRLTEHGAIVREGGAA